MINSKFYEDDYDLAPNGRLFGAKSIGKVYLQSKFVLIEPDSEKISPCVSFNSSCSGIDYIFHC